MMKVKKRKKSTRMHGRKMGTHGWGARKKHKKSGHRGGSGLSGTGKRNDQRKTLMTKLYGGKYFGKQGITSKGTKKDKRDRIHLKDIEERIETFIKKGIVKKSSDGFEINLSKYKILDHSGKYELKNKLIIKALEASDSAVKKVEKKGGEIKLPSKKKAEKEE